MFAIMAVLVILIISAPNINDINMPDKEPFTPNLVYGDVPIILNKDMSDPNFYYINVVDGALNVPDARGYV